jgi:glycosyltransferase involved in cell wall biosynthesis
MACGKPVIASRCSALPELVVHGETGILCPVGDVDAFVSAARQLGTDSDMCRRFGDAGRRRVAAQFGFSSMIERHLHVYESALG